ncbi:putative palmitoyltransferase ZDHHC24 [Tubulanus polymorphus]|uniref:putative palmitoyltransferase ZDHHC24 n=1 Tax=Tubulanus polymorphus TaxID=672921 RepID=UPI003DA43C91
MHFSESEVLHGRRSLKEKLVNVAYHNTGRQNLTLGRRIDTLKIGRFGLIFFWCMITSLTFCIPCIVLPKLYPHPPDYWIRVCIFFFVLMEGITNWILLRRHESQWKPCQPRASEVPQLGWNYCIICEQNAPPRSHHCKVCQICILKRDHHCFFANVCVGFFNRRYYIVCVFYILLTNAYAIYLISAYLYSYINIFSGEFVAFIPVIQFVLVAIGSLPITQIYLIWQVYLCLSSLCMAVVLFSVGMFISLIGSTEREMSKSISDYIQVGTLISRIRTVFGPYWIVNFIIPLTTSPVGDGIHWKSR